MYSLSDSQSNYILWNKRIKSIYFLVNFTLTHNINLKIPCSVVIFFVISKSKQ